MPNIENPNVHYCPYCGKPYLEREQLSKHSVYCDLNPEIQKRLPDLYGLTFEKCNCLIRITEVVPGKINPIYASVITFDNMMGSECCSFMRTRMSYRAVMGRTFDKGKEYDQCAKKLIEDIQRTVL